MEETVRPSTFLAPGPTASRFLCVQSTDGKRCGEIISRRILRKGNIQQGGHLFQESVVPGRKLPVSLRPITFVRERTSGGIRGNRPRDQGAIPWTAAEKGKGIPGTPSPLFDTESRPCVKIRPFGHVMDDEHCALEGNRGRIHFHPDPIYGIDLLVGGQADF